MWAIAFKDGEDSYFWRTELYNESGEFIDYAEVKTFKTKDECEEFRGKYTDSHAFDFYAKEITQEELDKYEKEVGKL